MIDPMESFLVKNILPINLFGIDISITNSSIFMLLVVAIISGVLWYATIDRGIIPTKLQLAVEKLFFFIGNIVKSNIQKKSIEVFPYITALFLFIMFGNILGLFPFAFSYTTQICVTIGMAIIVFVASIVIGFMTQGISYLRRFCPSGLPRYLVPFFIVIELMAFLFRPLSLGIRLFANMVSGHIMIEVMAGFASMIAGVMVLSYFAIVPLAVDVILTLFKLAVCMLQAYIFVVLSCMYISESLETQKH